MRKPDRTRARNAVLGLLVAVLLIIPGTSEAQTTTRAAEASRVFVDVNLSGTASPAGRGRVFTSKFLLFGEAASTSATYPKPSRATVAPLADFSGGFMFKRSVGVGLNYTRVKYGYDDVVGLGATIPHPLVLNASSSDTEETNNTLTRTEAATNMFLAIAPVRTNRFELRILFGPSIFSYKADMVRDVLYGQAYEPSTPLNTVTINGMATEKATGTALGIHLGGDFTYFFTRAFGVGGGVRLSRGTVTLDREPLSTVSQDIRVGSTLIFLGARFRVGR